MREQHLNLGGASTCFVVVVVVVFVIVDVVTIFVVFDFVDAVDDVIVVKVQRYNDSLSDVIFSVNKGLLARDWLVDDATSLELPHQRC